ncbi:1-acyl-sn-glycerol-3-phosphate acyltransferase [Actinobaculum massiliense]|uniref:1-acyl-sn-glycerol-3-phosphate acyltransferase n=1 Tax=Actinobaculum massiliense TaxID=202789 RepID=UPI00288985B0|nr:1-acyl-sn-glycerol-3-phosphate acyltransferase [Actinobaculum massiliense]
MGFKSIFSRTYMMFSNWKFVHEPIPDKVVAIGGPHSSMWDGWFNVMAFWREHREMKFLVKASILKIPVIGSIVKWAGGIAVDRSRHNGLVAAILEEADASDRFTLVLAPEGTRKQVKYLKSGFYRIALKSGMPVALGFIDATTKSYGWWKHMYVSGDITADMDILRKFYDGKVGQDGKKTFVPRLRAEDDDAARQHLLGDVDLAEARAYAIRMNRETGGVGITE